MAAAISLPRDFACAFARGHGAVPSQHGKGSVAPDNVLRTRQHRPQDGEVEGEGLSLEAVAVVVYPEDGEGGAGRQQREGQHPQFICLVVFPSSFLFGNSTIADDCFESR